jgi:cell division protein FtsN
VSSLQAKGFSARIQTGRIQTGDDAPILIGPYSSRVDLEEGRRKLQSAGVLAVEAAH